MSNFWFSTFLEKRVKVSTTCSQLESLTSYHSRASCSAISDAIEFAWARKTFGKRLIDHQVIRHKIAEMARLMEASWAMAESLACSLENKSNDEDIAGPMALFKVMASKTFELCAREASQILGGASMTRGEGKGQRVERLYREARSYAIPGGSEEILLDFSMKMSNLQLQYPGIAQPSDLGSEPPCKTFPSL